MNFYPVAKISDVDGRAYLNRRNVCSKWKKKLQGYIFCRLANLIGSSWREGHHRGISSMKLTNAHKLLCEIAQNLGAK
jgi:hypothetical protein